MGEYFRPWRRKAGVVTLMLACLLTGGWIRSRWMVDQLFYLAGSNVVHVVYSCPQGVGWTRVEVLKGGPWINAASVGILSLESMETIYSNKIYPPPRWHDDEPCPEWVGLRVGTQFGEAPSWFEEQRYLIIPYWLTAIPSTLLSAILILWPSRRKPIVK